MHQTGGTALGMGGVMVVVCNCGFPKPLMVPFSTDGGNAVRCPQCATEFIVAQIKYDIRAPNQIALGVGAKAPPIQPATLNDLKELSRGVKPS